MSRWPSLNSQQCTDPNCSKCRRENRRIKLGFQYTNKKHNIKLNVDVTSSPTITTHQCINDLLQFLFLDDILSDEVRLVGFDRDGRYRRLNVADTQKPLQESGVIDGCTLYFEPTSKASPPKLSQLTIVGPDEVEKKIFEWYRAKTTLGMLLDYVIEQFSLQSLERERIHLLSIVEELNFFEKSDLRLSQFNLHTGMSIYVQLIPPLNPDEDVNVHVEYIYNNDKFVLTVPNTYTINELKGSIEKRVEGRHINDFKLHNAADEEIHSTDSDRILKSFGVKPGQTIFATFRVMTRKTQSLPDKTEDNVSTNSSASSKTKTKHDKVTVICKLPSGKPVTTQASVEDTIDQLIKQIETLIQNQRLVLSEMHLSNNHIDFKRDTRRCLADLGIKANDIINVTMKDTSPSYASVVSGRSSTSSKSEKPSTSQSASKRPIGLDNLGNSCYMNSAFQCLAHLPPLTSFFLESIDRAHLRDNEGEHWDGNPYDLVGDVTGAYADLLWNLWRCDESDHKNGTFKPTRIKERIGEKDSRFATKDQQDAQEFMSFFLDIMHQEFKIKNKNERNTIIKQLFFGEMTSTITCTACHKEESTTHPISFLSLPLNRQERTFWITFISRSGRDDTTCIEVSIRGRVGHVVEKFADKRCHPSLFYYILASVSEGEIDLETPLSKIINDEFIFMEQEKRCNNNRPEPLEIPQKKSTLMNCLEEFFSREELEDEWICQQETCKKKITPIKQLKPRALPSILIIQFKRFSHENGLHKKIETFVDYPVEGLNLSSFLPSSSEEAIYDLIAVSNHMGSISGGHYVAYAQHCISNRNDWYKFDDSYVTRVRSIDYPDDIVSRDAYLLFYIKRNILNKTTTI